MRSPIASSPGGLPPTSVRDRPAARQRPAAAPPGWRSEGAPSPGSRNTHRSPKTAEMAQARALLPRNAPVGRPWRDLRVPLVLVGLVGAIVATVTLLMEHGSYNSFA